MRTGQAATVSYVPHQNLVSELTAAVSALGDESSIPSKARFFKAVPGGYAEGDAFLGVTVPQLRAVARKYRARTTVSDCDELLLSDWHEVRLLGVFLLVELYKRGDDTIRKRVVGVVVNRLDRLNNWDLIDSCAPYTLGPWLNEHPSERGILRELAADGLVWRRRAAVLATFAFIRAGDYADTLELAMSLLQDSHDLIHKAVGWMLREVGERDRETLDAFLDLHAAEMPRTMLRYATEKHEPERRRQYLSVRPRRRTGNQ